MMGFVLAADKLAENFVNGKEGEVYLVKKLYFTERIRDMTNKKYIRNFDDIKDYVVYRLINADRNKELLEVVPHINFLDLSIIFHCISEKKQECTASNLIQNSYFRQWDIPLNELYQAADENTQRILGYEIKNMRNVMCDMIKKNPERPDYCECMTGLENSIPMYLLSNKNRTEGAACMLYPELIRDFANALGNSLFIVPSSVNELLLLPFLGEDVSPDIKNLIKEVNDSCLKPEDILSYSLYYYNRESNQIGIC